MLVDGFATFPNTFLEEMLNRSLFFADKHHLSCVLLPSQCGSSGWHQWLGESPAARLIVPFGEKAAVELVQSSKKFYTLICRTNVPLRFE